MDKKIIDKNQIRNIIFYNSEKKKLIKKYLHKEVDISRKKFQKKNKNKKIVFLDIPLLFENKIEKICNIVCSAISPLYLRQRRALQRKGMTKKLFMQIIKSQTNDLERKRKSNFIIDTSKTKNKTCLQIDNIIYDILK